MITLRFAACLLISLFSLSGCTSQPEADVVDTESALVQGTWEGSLTPMNHPDQVTPLTFSVTYENDALAMTLGGPGGMEIPIRDAHVDGDTLRFEFNEPEENVLLKCGLAGAAESGYEGRCADESGKWALVSMTPPMP